jgi:hypothetical protein
MPKLIFTERSTDFLVLTYDSRLLDEPGFGDKLDDVLDRIREETEDGQLLCEYVEQDPGQIFIRYMRFAPLRVIEIRSNRLEKQLQDLINQQAAA